MTVSRRTALMSDPLAMYECDLCGVRFPSQAAADECADEDAEADREARGAKQRYAAMSR